MSILFRVDGDATAPKPVECATPRYPHTDADGVVIYENTHFSREVDAWAWLQSDSRAHQELLARRLVAARNELRRLEMESANAVIRQAAITEGFERWSRAIDASPSGTTTQEKA